MEMTENGPISVSEDSEIPEEVKSILKRSCYDCHSSRTNLPIYSYIFPANLFLQNHVREGRESLNFSKWDSYTKEKRATLAFNIVEEVEGGTMPLQSYILFHWDTPLEEDEIQTLTQWENQLDRMQEEAENQETENESAEDRKKTKEK